MPAAARVFLAPKFFRPVGKLDKRSKDTAESDFSESSLGLRKQCAQHNREEEHKLRPAGTFRHSDIGRQTWTTAMVFALRMVDRRCAMMRVVRSAAAASSATCTVASDVASCAGKANGV